MFLVIKHTWIKSQVFRGLVSFTTRSQFSFLRHTTKPTHEKPQAEGGGLDRVSHPLVR